MEAAGLRLRPVRTKPAVTSTFINEVEENEKEPVTPAGCVFCDPLLNCQILVIFGFKNPINLQALKEGTRSSLLQHKRFCSVVNRGKNGKLYWVPTTVNLDDHVFIPAITDEEKNSSDFVEDYAARLAQAPPLDRRRPLFEIHILRAKLGNAMENVVFRVHHALGDGTSLMSLLLACTRRVDQPESLPTVITQTRKISRKNRNSTASILVYWKEVISLIWLLLLTCWYTFLDVCNFVATSSWMDDSQTPIKGFPGIESLPKKLAHRTVSLEDIRIVKQQIQGTVNDVVLGMLGAGLSKYLQKRDHTDTFKTVFSAQGAANSNGVMNSNLGIAKHASQTQGDVLNGKKALGHLRIRASALINTRPSPGLQELKNMMCEGSQARWGNEMGYIILPVPISDQKDPLEYARKAKSISDKKKISLEAHFTYKSGSLLMKLTGAEIPTKLTYRCTSHATLSFSNIAGPSEEVQLFGNPITHIIPTVTGQPQSLCVHIQSYMGKVTIISFAVKDIIPDPLLLCDFMVTALEDMKQKVMNS